MQPKPGTCSSSHTRRTEHEAVQTLANTTQNSYQDLRYDVAWVSRDETEIIFHDVSYDLSA